VKLIDKLKSAHSFHGDPLHREAWEEIEKLRKDLADYKLKLRAAYKREAHWISKVLGDIE